jgi:hypothetical protein
MIEVEFRNVDISGGRKTGEKPSKQGSIHLFMVRGERLAATPPMLPITTSDNLF